jgi:glycosyltransferase involved in cell wall biosynthesis
VVIRAGLDGFSGYGQAVAAIGDELTAAGVPVAFRPIGKPSPDFVTTPTATLARADAGAPEPHELLVALPNQALDPARRTTVLSMWEASRIPPDWAAKLNAAARVVVPCAWNRDGFRASGVTAPVDVIPLGVDLAVFRPGRPRDPAAPFTVGCAGRTAHGGVRKGLDDVIAAFLAAFPGDPGVRLRVKCWADCKVNDPGDPRVSIEREPLTAGALAGWYRSLDAFASASRSEGFGLMPLQALASGVPVIATAYGGHAEYLDGRVGYPVAWAPRGRTRTRGRRWAAR